MIFSAGAMSKLSPFPNICLKHTAAYIFIYEIDPCYQRKISHMGFI